MLSTRSSGTMTARARLESRARHAASMSRAVTGAPSLKRASDRSVTVQRPSGPCSHDRASAGRTRPWQSTRINVSYSWAKTKRSATLRGNGACAGSTGSVSAIVTVSRDAGRPAAIKHAVSPAARAGAGGANSPRGTPPPEAAAASRPEIELGRFGDAEHDGRRAALEERHLGRRLEEKRHGECVAVEADGAVEIAGADEDLADGGETELRGCSGHSLPS